MPTAVPWSSERSCYVGSSCFSRAGAAIRPARTRGTNPDRLSASRGAYRRPQAAIFRERRTVGRRFWVALRQANSLAGKKNHHSLKVRNNFCCGAMVRNWPIASLAATQHHTCCWGNSRHAGGHGRSSGNAVAADHERIPICWVGRHRRDPRPAWCRPAWR
jgi:hypothetical protein